jgi:hypothetical protein
LAKTKTAKKSAANQAGSKSALPQAPPEHYFILADGRVLKDLKELADVLNDLADHIYRHHVNEQKNDFARWTEDIFKEAELAERMRKASNKHNTQLVIYRHILDRL